MAIKLVSVPVDRNLFPNGLTPYGAAESKEVTAPELKDGTILGQTIVNLEGRLFAVYTVRVDD